MPLSERRQCLQSILPKRSATVSVPLSVIGRGCQLFELMCTHDLEGIVAKRLHDPYDPRVRWLKIKNSAYTQQEGRPDLFDSGGHPIQTARCGDCSRAAPQCRVIRSIHK